MKWKNIRISDASGETIYDGPFNELPVKEEYIIKKSVELYQEPEPCIIYRTHILKKLYLEMLDAVGEKPKKGLTFSCNQWSAQKEVLELALNEAYAEFL